MSSNVTQATCPTMTLSRERQMSDIHRVRSHLPSGASKDPDSTTDIARLDMADKIRHYNYNSIWEQQKHFTWLISIILSAQAIVLAGTKLDSSDKIAILCVASIVGIMISIIGFRVQRIEGVYSCQANELFAKEYQIVYPDARPPYQSGPPNKRIPNLIVSCLLGKAGVRDHFQVLFLAFMTVFTAIAIYACVSL
jgi:hypothetical protein